MLINRKKYRLFSDEELITRYTEKPKSVILQVLYERYGHLVLGLCIKHMKNKQDAEDVCSSIFEKLPERIQKHEIQYFKSWLYQVSRNECLMILRKNKPHFKTIEEQLIVNRDQDVLVNKEEQEAILRKMEDSILKLKEEQKQCIVLFYIKEQSYQEISETLSMTIKAVKSNIQNGKRNLKIIMEAKP